MSGLDTGNIPESVWEGTFRVYGVDVRCHVLSDGRRIIESDSMNALLEAMEAKSTGDPGDLAAFDRWRRGEAVDGIGDAIPPPAYRRE